MRFRFPNEALAEKFEYAMRDSTGPVTCSRVGCEVDVSAPNETPVIVRELRNLAHALDGIEI